MIKARSSHNAMIALKPTVLMMAVTDPLNWDNAMDLVRGNDFMVDARDIPCTRYLINDAYILVGREPNPEK